MVSLKSLGDIMKNQRILRRRKLAKLEKKRIKRTTRNKNIKEHEKNMVIHAVRKMEAAKSAGQV